MNNRSSVSRAAAFDRIQGIDEGLRNPVRIVAPLALSDAVTGSIGVSERPIRAVSGRLETILDIGWRQRREGAEQERSNAGDMRGRHAGPHLGRVAAARPVRIKLSSRRGDIDRRTVIAEFGEGVVTEVEEQPT